MDQEVHPPVLPPPAEMSHPSARPSYGDTPYTPAPCMVEEDYEDSRMFSVPQLQVSQL